MNYYFTVLRKYANVEGRARRAEYWYFILFHFIVSITLGLMEAAMHTSGLMIIYSVAIILPSLAVGMRRMHDVGKSGWYIFIPIYGLVLACVEGNKGPNEYGPDPKHQDALLDEIPYSY